jgi:hypothetical protein
MARTDTELTDAQAARAKAALRSLKATLGSAAQVADHLSRFAGKTISAVSVTRWLSETGRPGAEAWKALRAAGKIEDEDGLLPLRPSRPELSSDEIADLKVAVRLLTRIAARLP